MKTSRSQEGGRKFLIIWGESIELGVTKMFFFLLVPSPHRIVNALQLQDYLKKQTRKLSAGITRKVCFVLPIMSTVMLIAQINNPFHDRRDLVVL